MSSHTATDIVDVSDFARSGDADEADPIAAALHESSIRLGERLREVREQRRMSLKEVEAHSNSEFKASVLGAYERAERMLSVERLDRLAQFYGVPVERLLPRPSDRAPERAAEPTRKLTIDLTKLSTLSGSPFDKLDRYVSLIRSQRGDHSQTVLTVRAEDAQAIAAMLQVPAAEVADRLTALDLLN